VTARRTRPAKAVGGNPSRFTRLPVAALALLGSGVSTYLALYQYRVINRVWDPVFRGGSKKVLDSSLSRALPVPDAALGAAAYAFEAVLELVGRRDRWRTQPKLVLLVGAASATFALTGTVLTVSQPMLSGTFCTLCLTSAAISLLVAAGVSGEVRAALGS
jgi:uncharacterized membrane protein